MNNFPKTPLYDEMSTMHYEITLRFLMLYAAKLFCSFTLATVIIRKKSVIVVAARVEY